MGVVTTEQGDEKFEEFLRRAAADYNAPSADVPREEMWSAITDRRVSTRRPGASPRLWWIGMAATLIIGVAIGRFALRTPAPAVVSTGPVAPASSPDSVPVFTYRAASAAHFARAEALLTAFRASAPDATGDAQIARWASDMLANTRLLLDSPAAKDPERQALLRDLEAVLMQLTHPSPLPGAAGATEGRSQVNRSLERTQVLSRLRSVLPAGPYSGS